MDSLATKRCCGCKRDLPTASFSKHAKRKDGLQTQCKQCAKGTYDKWRIAAGKEAWAEYQRGWGAANRDKQHAISRRHYENHREQEVARVVAHRKANADHYREYNREWLVANAEQAREWRRLWLTVERNREYHNRRRANREAATIVPFTREQLAAKMAYWGNLCWICKVKPMEVVDHVKPLTKGGPHVLSNLRPACRSCNSKKHNKWPYSPPR